MKTLSWILVILACLVGPVLAAQEGSATSMLGGMDRYAPSWRSPVPDLNAADKSMVADRQPADAVNTTWVGAWAAGPSWAVNSNGNLACFGNGGFLEVVDTMIPGHPARLGRAVMPGLVQGIDIDGDHAYVACGVAGLRIVDISDPAAPLPAGLILTGGSVQDVVAVAGYAYIADGPDGLRIIDVSDPAAPVEVGSLPGTGGLTFFSGIDVSGNYAYVTDWYGSFRVIDVSDPAAPVLRSAFQGTGSRDVAIVDGYAYVAAGGRFQIFDVSNPAAVTLKGELGMTHATGIAAGGNSAYLVDVNQLKIIDVAQPQAPAVKGSLELPAVGLGVALVAPDHAYVADDRDGLRIVDVGDPTAPQEVDVLDTAAYSVNTVVRGGYAYLAQWGDVFDGGGSLRIINTQDPANPLETDSFVPASPADFVGFIDLAARGGYAFAIDAFNGMWIIDISDPAAAVQAGFIDLGGNLEDIAVGDGHAYVTGGSGLQIINVGNPAAPFVEGSFGRTGRIALGDGYVYLAAGNIMSIVDVSVPTAPGEVGLIPVSSFSDESHAIALSGKRVYISLDSGLTIFDVTDPTLPVEMSSLAIGPGAQGVAVHGDFVYLSDPFQDPLNGLNEGLHIVDASDPYHPVEVASYDTGVLAWSVTAHRDLVYVPDDLDGLQIIRNDLENTDLLVTLTAQNGPLTIPETGGGFSYDAAVENTTAADLTADVVLEAVLPGGDLYPVRSRSGVVFPAGSTTVRHGVFQAVPAGAPAGAYAYRLSVIGGDGVPVDSDQFTFGKLGTLTAAKTAGAKAGWTLRGWDDDRDPEASPAPTALLDAYPNPGNPGTTISYAVLRAAVVSLRIFDLRGRLVRTLVSAQSRAAGTYTETWRGDDDDGRTVAGGVYLYRLEAGDMTVTRRITLVK